MPTAEATPVLMGTRPSAVAWIDRHHALVATNSVFGSVTMAEIRPRLDAIDDATYLARVVDVIGDRERIAILGPDEERLALEREYVLIFRRPERLIDVEPSSVADRAELTDRLRTLEST